MLALYRSGRQAEALEAFRSARAALDELGIEPSAELRAAREGRSSCRTRRSVRGRRSSAETPLLPGPLVPARRFRSSAARASWRRCARCWSVPREARAAFVLLASQAGGGKTRLVRELALEAVADGVLVLYGSSSATITVPFQPVREWLEFLLRVCDPETLEDCVGDGGEQLSRLVPEFAALGRGIRSEPPVTPGPIRYLLQSAVDGVPPAARVVSGRSCSSPTICTGRTAGRCSSLGRLARTAPEARMVVVAAFRDRGEEISAELSETLADLSRLEGVTRLALGNLSDEEVGAFIRASTEAEASGELVSTIGELTSGTPLLLCELWRDLVAAGDVEVSHDGVRLSRPVGEPARLGADPRRRADIGGRASHARRARCSSWRPSPAHGSSSGSSARPPGSTRAPSSRPSRRRSRSGCSRSCPTWSLPAGSRTSSSAARSTTRSDAFAARSCTFASARRSNAPTPPIPPLSCPSSRITSRSLLRSRASSVASSTTCAPPTAATATSANDEAAARLSSALELGIADPRERARVQAELGLLLYHTGRVGESEAILSASLDAATSLEERGLALRALVHRAAERLRVGSRGRLGRDRADRRGGDQDVRAAR